MLQGQLLHTTMKLWEETGYGENGGHLRILWRIILHTLFKRHPDLHILISFFIVCAHKLTKKFTLLEAIVVSRKL